MVLRRKEKEEFDDEEDFDDEEKEEDERVIPSPTVRQRTSSPPALPAKVRQEHDAGDIEPILQPVAFVVYDDEGTKYPFPPEQESIARAFARLFKLASSQ